MRHLKHSELHTPQPLDKRAAEAAEVRRENAENNRLMKSASDTRPDISPEEIKEITN